MPAQNTIKCSKCGALKGTTNVRLKALTKKFGTEAKFLKQYVCRDCKSGNANVKAGRVRNSKLPTSKVICSKCDGKFGTTKVRMDKLIAQYGSLEEVHSTYVCRKCRKELNVDKRGRMKPVKNKRRPKPESLKRGDDGEIVLPKWMQHFIPRPRVPASAESLKATGTCWHPTMWADNGKVCDGCPSIEKDTCGCPKTFSKEKKEKKVKKPKTKKYKVKKKSKKKK